MLWSLSYTNRDPSEAVMYPWKTTSALAEIALTTHQPKTNVIFIFSSPDQSGAGESDRPIGGYRAEIQVRSWLIMIAKLVAEDARALRERTNGPGKIVIR